MMGPLQLSALAPVIEAVGGDGDSCCQGVSIDTRTLKPGDLYVALAGERFDGHAFLDQAKAQGAVAAVVERPDGAPLPHLQVADGRRALGRLGQHNRRRFTGKLAAVTGSSGKTTVKEMLACVLAQQGPVLATRGNLNNEIGVPLTLLEIAPAHRFAVIEMGANHLGEIDYTSRLAEPQVAVLTNAMGAHLEGFGSLQGVVEAKGEIFEGLQPGGTAVINADDPHAEQWRSRVQALAEARGVAHGVLTFSRRSADADIYATEVVQGEDGCHSFQLHYHREQVPVSLRVLGAHNVSNALAAAAAALALGLSLVQVAAGLAAFSAVSGRMQLHRLALGQRLIDDSYNANPGAVKAAIDTLCGFSGERTLVLGDMAELGSDAEALHGEVGAYAASRGIERLLVWGDLSRAAVSAYRAAGGRQGESFESKIDLVRRLQQGMSADSVILIKGSRSARMDEVVALLKSEDDN